MAQGDAAPQSGITSKKFKDQCSLQFAYPLETFYKTIGDKKKKKKKSYTLRTPLSAWDIAQSRLIVCPKVKSLFTYLIPKIRGGSRLQRKEYGQICPKRKIFRQKR